MIPVQPQEFAAMLSTVKHEIIHALVLAVLLPIVLLGRISIQRFSTVRRSNRWM